MPEDFTKPTGADDEIDGILSLAYACTRVWEAWSYNTMSEHDFEPAANTGIRDDLIAWRDAAVRSALEAAKQPAEPAGPTIAERVRATLVGVGFIDGKDAPGRRAFHVTEGVGVALGPFWAHASAAARSEQLATLAYLLENEDVDVPERGQFLYVPESGRPDSRHHDSSRVGLDG